MAAGVYIHIPFCKSRCSYCDFATDVYRDPAMVERYVDAVCSEISSFTVPNAGSAQIDSIYFGGGTPSLLLPGQLKQILEAVDLKFQISDLKVRSHFSSGDWRSGSHPADPVREISHRIEVTMEMNPATVTPESLAAYRDLGINRASFGVQTFNDRALKLLARGHDANDARTTFHMLGEAGFDNISFDLIGGLPGQTLNDWKRNLDEAIKLDPEHISLYLLEIHEGTPLAEQVRSGRRP